MSVSIITINYNGYDDTCELIDSLFQNETYPFEIIVVDNASKNNDGERLKVKYPNVKVIISPTNIGFAGGNNLGYKSSTGEYILLMNNDMIVKAPFIKPLVDRFNSSPDIGLVSPKIKYTYAPDTIQYAGYTELSTITLRNVLIGVAQKDNGQYDIACVTGSVHGACLITSRKLIEKVAFMTDIYFLFYEELDWSLQMRNAGFQSWYEPASCVYHKESMTIKRGTPLRLYYLTRSRMLFVRRNRNGFCKIASCVYQLTAVLSKQSLDYIIKRDWKMLQALWNGMFNGLIVKIDERG
ncbi:MAG: glycosyltransferase family 2 protein [Muribaculaceae bacterium]